MAEPSSSPLEPRREIRVFVSSTFRDMQAERDELLKRIFPQLRKLCESRGVTWGEVDLRWGITDEQSAEGKVLPICLAEIRNCRPYFLGLLGERYGWVPLSISAELIAAEPWLAEHQGRSVTELEILHGVLNDPEMAGQAFFYFRSPAYVDSLSAGEQEAFRESPSREELEELGPEAAASRAAERRLKLQSLKARIRASGLPVREDYPDPRTLGQLVVEDLQRIIDDAFPEGSAPSPLDREAAEHEAFSRSRARVYIGGEKYFPRLDQHAQGDGPPLVVLGDSGSGKTALVANWVERYRSSHPEETVIRHFIGATVQSADWAAMLRRILEEFRRGLGVELEIPGAPEALRASFANALHLAAARGRVVLVLDALNQLEDRDQAPDLVWLPPEVPANVRLIVSTLPGRPLADLERRGWPTLTVEPLTPEDRRRLVQDYLALSSKTLSSERAARITAAPQAANPLYLRALLDELRLWGAHERLDDRIGYYLAAEGIDDLYEKILERFEQDYEEGRPGLVREAFSLLWAARRGLSEKELLDLLGSDGQPLPGAHWSPLFLAAEAALVNRSGLLGFFHDFLRQAVQERYLPTPEARDEAHLRVGRYLSARDWGPRLVDELPWQLAKARCWEELADLFAILPFFSAAIERDRFEVMAYWEQIERHSERRMVETYRFVLAAPEQFEKNIWDLATLFDETGHPQESLQLRAFLVDRCRHSGNRGRLAHALGNQATSLANRGDLDRAMALLREQEEIFGELGDRDGLGTSLSNRGRILETRGDLDGATALHKEAERIFRELENKNGLQASLGNQADVLRTRGDLDGALALLEEKERICRELGSKISLHSSLGMKADILGDRGDLDGAMALYKKIEQIFRELGDQRGLSASLGSQGVVLAARGELDGAMALFQESERICRELGDSSRLARVLGNQANILRRRWDLDGAMSLTKQEERIFRNLGDKDGLQISLGRQALILEARGDLAGAMELHREKERICREMRNKRGLAVALGNQARILWARRDLGGAMVLYQEAERICRELGDPEGLAAALMNQACTLVSLGRATDALSLAEEADRLASNSGLDALVEQLRPSLELVRNAQGRQHHGRQSS